MIVKRIVRARLFRACVGVQRHSSRSPEHNDVPCKRLKRVQLTLRVLAGHYPTESSLVSKLQITRAVHTHTQTRAQPYNRCCYIDRVSQYKIKITIQH